MFNVSEIIQNQIPDPDGNVIPARVQEGSGKISGTHGDNEHILVAMDVGVFNVRKATCNGGCVWCNGETSAWLDSPTLSIGGSRQVKATDQWNTGWQYDFTSLSSWSSSLTQIATIDSSTGMAKGVSAGTTQYQADFQDFLYGQSCNVNPPCPIGPGRIYPISPGPVLLVTISIQSSGTPASDNSARDAYKTENGTYNMGAIVATGGYCSIGYQASGALAPSSYTGTVNLVRTKGGVVYTGSTGQTVETTYANGTPDTSNPQFEDTNPHSGGSNGKVYDLDAPGASPAVSQVGRVRYNFFENAQLPDGTFVANEVGFYVRASCNWGAAGNSFRNDVSGDNVLGLGSTKTSWNLQ
jgi:hypothetical protein